MVKELLALAAVMLFATAGAASAQAYPPQGNDVTASDSTAEPGQQLPTTGSSSTVPMTQLAIGALAGGGLLVLLANRRRSATVDEPEPADRETAGV